MCSYLVYCDVVDNKSYRKLVRLCPVGEPINRTQLLALCRQVDPSFSRDSLSWLLYFLLKNKDLEKAGSSLYMRRGSLKRYEPHPSFLAYDLQIKLQTEFPNLKAVIYDTTSLNEWLNELLAHNSILVEVNRHSAPVVFDSIKSWFSEKSVLLNPTEDERYLYSKGEPIIVADLHVRAPLLGGNYSMCLEKLIVDLFADDTLRSFFSASEIPEMVSLMKKKYFIDEKTLFSYAKRRNVDQEVSLLIPSSPYGRKKKK